MVSCYCEDLLYLEEGGEKMKKTIKILAAINAVLTVVNAAVNIKPLTVAAAVFFILITIIIFSIPSKK